MILRGFYFRGRFAASSSRHKMPAMKKFALSVCIAGGIAARLLAAESDFQDVRRFDSLTVGSSAIPVRDLALSSGHLSLTLKTGAVAPVRAGEEVVGLYFEGTGTMEYKSDDPVEFPVDEWENRKTAGLPMQRSATELVFRDGFERVLWLSAGKALPDLPGGAAVWKPGARQLSESVSAGPSLEASFRRQREKFGELRSFGGHYGAPLSHAFALQLGNAPGEPLVLADIDGGKADLRYVYDAVDLRTERLTSAEHPEFGDSELKRTRVPVILSELPIGRDRRDPLAAAFALTAVAIDLTASDGKDANLVVDETILPVKRAAKVLRFDLDSQTLAPVGAAGIDRRTHRVRSITDASGRSLAFDHRHDELVVELASPAPPDQPVKLRFQIDGNFLVRPGGDSFWQLGVTAWFPQPELNGQYYTFHAKVKVKKPFIPFTPGRTIGRGTEGEYNTVETDIDKPIQFAVVLAGKYEFSEETRNGILVRVASYAGKNDRAMKQLTNLAFGIIEYYQNFLGPFPFPEFNILEKNEYGYGQAPPGTMFITKEAFNPYLGEDNQFFSQGVNERFAHEIAHQYWGHVVKMPSLEEQWITESFAECSAGIFLKDFRKGKFDALLADWKRRAASSADIAPIPLVNRLYSSTFRDATIARQNLLYFKGAVILETIHKEMGDDPFLTFLKSYQKTARWKFGSTKSVAAMLQYMTKKDWTPFFEKYYWGTAMP